MASPEIGTQLRALRLVNDGLRRVGVWLLYELLFPPAQEQLAAVGGGQAAAYDRKLRPTLVIHVISSLGGDNSWQAKR
jgi:hypothetical protein